MASAGVGLGAGAALADLYDLSTAELEGLIRELDAAEPSASAAAHTDLLRRRCELEIRERGEANVIERALDNLLRPGEPEHKGQEQPTPTMHMARDAARSPSAPPLLEPKPMASPRREVPRLSAAQLDGRLRQRASRRAKSARGPGPNRSQHAVPSSGAAVKDKGPALPSRASTARPRAGVPPGSLSARTSATTAVYASCEAPACAPGCSTGLKDSCLSPTGALQPASAASQLASTRLGGDDLAAARAGGHPPTFGPFPLDWPGDITAPAADEEAAFPPAADDGAPQGPGGVQCRQELEAPAPLSATTPHSDGGDWLITKAPAADDDAVDAVAVPMPCPPAPAASECALQAAVDGGEDFPRGPNASGSPVEEPTPLVGAPATHDADLQDEEACAPAGWYPSDASEAAPDIGGGRSHLGEDAEDDSLFSARALAVDDAPRFGRHLEGEAVHAARSALRTVESLFADPASSREIPRARRWARASAGLAAGGSHAAWLATWSAQLRRWLERVDTSAHAQARWVSVVSVREEVHEAVNGALERLSSESSPGGPRWQRVADEAPVTAPVERAVEDVGAGCWNLLWTWRSPRIDFGRLLRFQRVNHFPGNSARVLMRKDLLYRSIQRQCVARGRSFAVMPPSFLLPREYVQFVSAFAQEEAPEAQASNVWILKPVDSSRGRGILLFNDLRHLVYSREVIVQRYICRPLTLWGRKLDLRLYVLVTSVQPLEAFIHREGLVRLASLAYDTAPSTFQDLQRHLTNTAVQRPSAEDRSGRPQGPSLPTKIRVSELFGRLHRRGVETRALWEAVVDVVVRSLVATETSIQPHPCAFELFGVDVLLEEKEGGTLQPWLLEVNCSPSLACDSELDRDVKHQLLADTLRLIDPVPFHRPTLEALVNRRLDDLGKGPRHASRRPAVDLVTCLPELLHGRSERPWGHMPASLGGFERIAPPTEALQRGGPRIDASMPGGGQL